MIEIPQLLEAKSPAILFSGGKDSLLLLDEVRRIRPETTVIHFYDRLSPQVERVIKEWELEILSWRPAEQYLIPWGQDLALVSEYSFGDARLPVLRDVVVGDGCRRRDKTECFDYPFDLTLWGMKKCDELHPVMPAHFEREMPLGLTRLIAPLFDLTDEEVLAEIDRRNLPYEPFADVVTVSQEYRAFLSEEWNGSGALNYFARRFGYLKEAA